MVIIRYLITLVFFSDPRLRWILRLPEAIVPKTMLKICYFGQLFEFMNYGYRKAFEQCKGCNDKIYTGLALGTARSTRGQGLGQKLLQASLDYARKEKCSHMYVFVSGIYSQRIFRNNGFTVITERRYEDFKDKQGRVLVQDKVHKVCQVVALKLN